MKLSDLIAKGEGLREYAFLDRADLIRTDDDFTKRLVSFPLAGLYTRNADGTFAFTDDTALNFPLREMDEVLVQSAWGLAGKDKSVTLEGHVKEPGTVVLAKGMTLYDLLFMRGGFQDPDFTKTTFLEVGHLTRKVPGTIGQRIIPFHVGKLLANDPNANMPLEDADVVRIYASNDLQQARTVSIDGLVNKPGTYPMSEELTVEDLVVLAGGLSSSAVKAEAVIARPIGEGSGDEAGMEPTSIVVPIDTTLSAASSTRRTPLRASDRVSIRHKFGWEPLDVAGVTGQVKYPGNYPIPRGGARISDLIRRAGGLRDEAFPQGATLIRNTGDISTASADLGGGQEITIDLPSALAKPNGPADLELREGDRIYIPAGSGLVQVKGAVQRPMAVQHALGSKLSDYINICGGYKDTADIARVIVISPNNAAQVVAKGQDPVLLPGTVVNVPLLRESARMQIVEVKGSVAKPALVQHIDDAPLGYYIGVCGGFTPNADLDRVVVILPDGRMLTKEGSGGFNPTIPAGSTIVVTTRPMAGGGG
jgi:protein involved in polysaccharide export with SLBB domain